MPRLSIASERLRDKKEIVIEHLKSAGEYVTSLHTAADLIESKFNRKCRCIEDGISEVVETLKKRQLVLFQELEAEKDDQLRAVAKSVQFSSEIMLNTEEVN